VSYGGVRGVMDAAGARHLMLDPYVTLVVMGSLLMPLSIAGFWASVIGARRTLFLYFCSVLLAATVLVYVSALCFLYAASDRATSELVRSRARTRATPSPSTSPLCPRTPRARTRSAPRPVTFLALPCR
jgi:hypothetical protein